MTGFIRLSVPEIHRVVLLLFLLLKNGARVEGGVQAPNPGVESNQQQQQIQAPRDEVFYLLICFSFFYYYP